MDILFSSSFPFNLAMLRSVDMHMKSMSALPPLHLLPPGHQALSKRQKRRNLNRIKEVFVFRSGICSKITLREAGENRREDEDQGSDSIFARLLANTMGGGLAALLSIATMIIPELALAPANAHNLFPERTTLPPRTCVPLSSPDDADCQLWHKATSGVSQLHAVQSSGGVEDSDVRFNRVMYGHDDLFQKRNMFTGDAWIGMMRLQRYTDLVKSVEDEEKLCPECTHNRRFLEQVWQTVSNEYFDQFDRFSQAQWSYELFRALDSAGGLLRTKAQTYRVVKAMVANIGDPYSSFLIPEEYRLALHRPSPLELKYLSYQYTGVGMQIGNRSQNGGFTIVAPFAGSPAEEVGIQAGERLLSIDGYAVDSMPRDKVSTMLRGPIGSQVELRVAGEGPNSSTRNINIERRALPLPPLKLYIIDAGDGHWVAYIRLHYFTHSGTTELAAAIREGEALGVDGYILDLRNNPGGVFEEAIAMAAFWLDCKDCNIAETVRSTGTDIEDFDYVADALPEDIFSRHPGVLTHAPVVTIGNRNSASASEVLIGALHDNHRTFVIGERTFGKGVVQYFFPMDDGSGLKLTVAKYLTPARYDISKKGGLVPDAICTDYPHAGGTSDECIIEAFKRIESMEEEETSSPKPSQLPYRWIPLDINKWLRSSY